MDTGNDDANSATPTLDNSTIPTENNIKPKTDHAKLLLPEMINEEKVKIRLTGGKFAYLIHPLELTKTDIAILQKQIEQLELIVTSA